MNGDLLTQALVYLTAAIVCVPVTKRLGMGSVLGYLAAGMLIGPFLLGFVGNEGQDIMHFAEFGIVMMLFLIGLELEPEHFWRMRGHILGMGAVQVSATTLLTSACLMALGFTWQAGLASGLAIAMSSTAIVLQSMKEKGLSDTSAGKGAFGVLLFQDISVIPVLAFLPLVAGAAVPGDPGHSMSMLEGLPGWGQALAVLGAGASVVLAGRFVIVPVLKLIAGTNLRELLTAAALLIVIATAYLMKLVGLSPALGTFLAGVVLANSEFRHELQSDIEPFKGLLLGLFFLMVGASINFRLLMDSPQRILSLIFLLMAIKTVVLIVTGRIFRLTFDQNLIFSLSLSQVGEFAFVLFAFIRQLNILSAPWADTMMAVTALSMTVTPFLLFISERFIHPSFGTPEAEPREADAIDVQHPVIIAGFGDFGSTIGRFLRANGIEATILDNNSDRVDLLRRMGFKVFYGDATRLDILKSAGAETAKILIAAISDPSTHYELLDRVQKHYPNLALMVRVRDRSDAYELVDSGVEDVYRETLDTSVRLGVDVLVRLGRRRYSAVRAGQTFIRNDEAAFLKLAPHRHDEKSYIVSYREQIRIQEQILSLDREKNPAVNDHAWEKGPGQDRQED